jgi:hypothetical protein
MDATGDNTNTCISLLEQQEGPFTLKEALWKMRLWGHILDWGKTQIQMHVNVWWVEVRSCTCRSHRRGSSQYLGEIEQELEPRGGRWGKDKIKIAMVETLFILAVCGALWPNSFLRWSGASWVTIEHQEDAEVCPLSPTFSASVTQHWDRASLGLDRARGLDCAKIGQARQPASSSMHQIN